MSDRRPVKVLLAVEECRDCGGNGCSWCADTGRVRESKPSPADLVAAVRAAVESGTIEGEVLKVDDSGRRDYFVPIIYMPGRSYGEKFLVIPLVERGEGGNK